MEARQDALLVVGEAVVVGPVQPCDGVDESVHVAEIRAPRRVGVEHLAEYPAVLVLFQGYLGFADGGGQLGVDYREVVAVVRRPRVLLIDGDVCAVLDGT